MITIPKKIFGLGSQSFAYVNNFIKIENKNKSDIIEIHNRPLVFLYLLGVHIVM